MKHLLILTLLISFSGNAQQEPLSGFYWNNYSYYNPAMSGVANKYEANVLYRNQWDNVEGAPSTLFVNYGMNLADKHGIGLNYSNESIGNTKLNQVKLNYNYQLKLDEDRKLAIGTAVSFQQRKWNSYWIPPTTGDDPAIPSSTTNFFNLDLGVSYYSKNLIAGLSVTQLPLYDNFDFYTNKPHVHGNLRYQLGLPNSKDYLIFETQLRTDFVKYSQDFNVGYNWRNILETGVGYRFSDAAIFNLTGIIAKKFRVGYLYSFTLNQLTTISRGTHEVSLSFRIPN